MSTIPITATNISTIPTIPIPRTTFLMFSAANGSRTRHNRPGMLSLAPTIKLNTNSFGKMRKEDPERLRTSPIAHSKNGAAFRFDRLQPSDDDVNRVRTLDFGPFMAREAILDEELWKSAYIRAEIHWEDEPCQSYIENMKMEFTEEEYEALKKRCSGQLADTNKCIVGVSKVEPNVIRSVVGTLDYTVRNYLQGETETSPMFRERPEAGRFPIMKRARPEKYGYVSNLCVQKSARRRKIGSNMMRFAIEVALLSGLESVFVHVHRYNAPALELYRKLGFEVVEEVNYLLEEEQMYLLRYRA
ncbi:GCN5-related N-acetyltransferase 6 [Hibiscus trionum]|uniref:GCN5-related N-acetyltransferase 6 n=1 Tax=Hibiscus trionum TaxID=183268 RepID=A0A9W7JL55_HIBTR|nr:GCN5-related N-acetyltransferase 6 [Hibiscus trionum]